MDWEERDASMPDQEAPPLDNDDRDGFFIGNTLRPIELNQKTLLKLQPQLLVLPQPQFQPLLQPRPLQWP